MGWCRCQGPYGTLSDISHLKSAMSLKPLEWLMPLECKTESPLFRKQIPPCRSVFLAILLEAIAHSVGEHLQLCVGKGSGLLSRKPIWSLRRVPEPLYFSPNDIIGQSPQDSVQSVVGLEQISH